MRSSEPRHHSAGRRGRTSGGLDLHGEVRGLLPERAIRWLREHFAEALRIEALAKHVGMSPSALHLHFKNMTALSPLQYQKWLRLQEARRLMLGEGLDAGAAAFRVGYESPSQFGREYRRQFGTSLKADVSAVRESEEIAV